MIYIKDVYINMYIKNQQRKLFCKKGDHSLSSSNKYRFETLEELQKTYPIHSVFSKRVEHYIYLHTYYNNNDLNIFKHHNDRVEILDDTTCITYKTEINTRIVDGYLYDGKYWYPAYNTYDGWMEYNESDIFEEEEITFDRSKY